MMVRIFVSTRAIPDTTIVRLFGWMAGAWSIGATKPDHQRLRHRRHHRLIARRAIRPFRVRYSPNASCIHRHGAGPVALFGSGRFDPI
jgi:hypothetical protein